MSSRVCASSNKVSPHSLAFPIRPAISRRLKALCQKILKISLGPPYLSFLLVLTSDSNIWFDNQGEASKWLIICYIRMMLSYLDNIIWKRGLQCFYASREECISAISVYNIVSFFTFKMNHWQFYFAFQVRVKALTNYTFYTKGTNNGSKYKIYTSKKFYLLWLHYQKVIYRYFILVWTWVEGLTGQIYVLWPEWTFLSSYPTKMHQ